MNRKNILPLIMMREVTSISKVNKAIVPFWESKSLFIYLFWNMKIFFEQFRAAICPLYLSIFIKSRLFFGYYATLILLLCAVRSLEADYSPHFVFTYSWVDTVGYMAARLLYMVVVMIQAYYARFQLFQFISCLRGFSFQVVVTFKLFFFMSHRLCNYVDIRILYTSLM